jgi:hypothetical protein
MVKQFTVNEWSVGSNPTMGEERMAEWLKAVNCKFTNDYFHRFKSYFFQRSFRLAI